MINGCFITGTDTDIGKTRVAASIIRALAERGRAVVGMKPVASGDAGRSQDAQRLIDAASVEAEYADVNPYLFAEPVSPHLAARAAGVEIDLRVITRACEKLASRADWVIVEGVGGWFAPLSETLTVQDMAQALKLPVVLVVGMRLGCLNHALLSARAIRQSGLPLAGWVANCIDPTMRQVEENIATLEQRMASPLLAVVAHDGDVPAVIVDVLSPDLADIGKVS